MTEPREVVITGVGLLSGLGEGLETTWDRLVSGPPSHDAETFAPFVVHRLGPVNFELQIPKKGDQRQMEPWQRTGVYTAGLALASAGVKGDAALLDRTDMIVAAGGGERDVAVDGKILTGIRGQPNPEAFVNERLMNDLRPTLFLAQLPNLVAGNISIVHGIVGSSRTFIGEESAGVDAVRVAHARIAARQSDITLVGGGYSAERLDIVLNYELACALLRPPFRPVWIVGREAASPSVPSGRSSCWRRASTPRPAAQRRWHASPMSRPGVPRGHRATWRGRWMACGPGLPARSDRARRPCCGRVRRRTGHHRGEDVPGDPRTSRPGDRHPHRARFRGAVHRQSRDRHRDPAARRAVPGHGHGRYRDGERAGGAGCGRRRRTLAWRGPGSRRTV